MESRYLKHHVFSYMGNAQSPTKKRRVTFHPGVQMDRFEEETRRFDHIVRLHRCIIGDDMELKDKLAQLIIKYLERCHGDTHMVNEELHYNRVLHVCVIGIETFQGIITELQVHALQNCLIEYSVLLM